MSRALMPIFNVPVRGRPVDGYLEELLESIPRRKRSIEEAMRRYGNLRVRRAALHSAVRDRSRRPKPRGYPPRIFISYRWGGPAEQNWTARLAAHLRGRGFRVLLDQEHLNDLGEHGIGIADYVSRIVDSHIVIVILSSGYVSGELREWLFEEGQLARLLTASGLRIEAILRDGTETVDWAGSSVIDLRSDPDDFSPIDWRFDYRGVVLDDNQEDALVRFLADLLSLFTDGRAKEVLAALRNHPQFAQTDEYGQALAHALAATGTLGEASATALRVLREGMPARHTIVDLCMLLKEVGTEVGDPRLLREALSHVRRVPIGGRDYGWRVRAVVADILDELGSHRAAINHYRQVLAEAKVNLTAKEQASVLNDLGYVRLFRLGQAADALGCFETAVRLVPTYDPSWENLAICLYALNRRRQALARLAEARAHGVVTPKLERLTSALAAGEELFAPGALTPLRVPLPTHGCPACGAEYALGPHGILCAGCGSTYVGSQGCPYCGERLVVPVGITESQDFPDCPVCAAGTVVRLA